MTAALPLVAPAARADDADSRWQYHRARHHDPSPGRRLSDDAPAPPAADHALPRQVPAVTNRW